jgi:MFS family permease|tara:strand:- start:30305 stop:31477 length:1173 start_codon:yes stop_codon:yes gene_type:complete
MPLEKKYSDTRMLKGERRVVGIVALIAMFRMFGLFALLPVLSIFSRELNGATPFLVGISVGAYGLTQALFQVPMGLLSDKIGRKVVIILGLCIFITGSLVAAYSTNIYGVIIGRFLQGAGAISATLAALLTDNTREVIRTKSMAILGVGIGTSFLIALIFGPVIASIFGVRSLFFLAAFVALLAMALLLLIPNSDKKIDPLAKLNVKEAFKPQLLMLDLYVFVLHLILTMMFVVLPIILVDQLTISLANHWKIYVSSLIISLLFSAPMIINDKRMGRRIFMFLSVILLLLSQLILVLSTNSWISITVSLVCFFSGFNFLEASLPARLSILAKDGLKGASLGVFSSFQFLGAFSGGVIGGWLVFALEPQNIFAFTTVLIIFWLLSLVFHKD